MSTNPLLHPAFEIPFDRIRAEHVEPAVRELIEQAGQRIERIAANSAPRTYANTLDEFDRVTSDLDTAIAIVRHIENVATTPEFRQAYNAIEPLASAFYTRIPLHDGLWRAIQSFAATPEAAALTGARKRFLKKTIDNFRRHGAGLPPDRKAELEKLDVELSRTATKFAENVLDDTNAWELIVEDESKLAGLPPTALTMARESAKTKGRDGWRFTLQQPSYLAVLTYLDDASIRETMYRAYQTRASRGEHANGPNIARILQLRQEKAALLGYDGFDSLILEDRMAHDGARAVAFLEDLQRKTQPFFERENAELQAFRREIEGPDAPALEPWDIGYYAEKLRKARYDFDEEMLRPYFPLDRVLAGLFQLVETLFGVRVNEKPGAPGWDPGVRFYHLLDGDGSLLGGFYADWYPRENKRQGAWMDAFIVGGPRDGVFHPHLGLMCGNMTPPSEGRPALLTHREVETVFHEFGHLLHHLLSKVEVRSLAGTSVPWDFVELPSQIMENWCWERQSLDLFARHWETGEPLPDDLFRRLNDARTFRAANAQMRQLSFGFVDLLLYRDYRPERDGDPVAWGRSILQRFSAARLPDDHAMLCSFTHLFANAVGYAAGYYSYKWAEVLDADAFTRFRREGVFSPQAGAAFRECILSQGDSDDPAELYRRFMGRDPDPAALLERAGLV
ncbi:MAG: M3 family metallopeptidase [Bryobacteraceae bacterium]